MLKFFRAAVTVVIVVALHTAGDGLAAADPNVATPPTQEKQTDDGWNMKLSLENITIDSVPNMAGAALVREGYVTATAKLVVEGNGSKGARTTLSVFEQVGCQVDLKDGVEISNQPQFTNSLPGLSTADLVPGNTDIGFLPTIQLNPKVTERVRPGHIDSWTLGERAYPPMDLIDAITKAKKSVHDLNENNTENNDNQDNEDMNLQEAIDAQVSDVAKLKVTDPLSVSVQNAHLAVDTANTDAACGGPVAVRLYATATMNTPKSWESVDIYSDIVTL